MNYTFEYVFIPQILANYEDEFALDTVRVFDDFGGLQITFETEFELGDRKPFNWDSLVVTKHISKELSYWLFNFPPQVGAVDAVLGIVIQYADKPPVYFTLENSPNGKYVLGMVDVNKHRNLCEVQERLENNEFKDLVFDVLKKHPELAL